MSTGTTAKKRRIEGDDFVDPPTPVGLYLKLLKDQRDCDVFFVVGPDRQRIGAHKVILKARSRYFEARLSKRWEQGSSLEGEGNEVVLEDEESPIFRSFLEHIYAYVFSPKSPVEAVKLLQMARYYQVSSLAARCEEELAKPFQPDDLLDIFVLSRNFGLENVMSKAGKTMADYFTQLVKSPAFEKADEATMKYLLERDDLNFDELELYFVLLGWVHRQIRPSSESRRWNIDILESLLPLIRFPTMDASMFTQCIASVDILSLQTKCDLFMYFLNPDEERRKVISKKFPYSTVPRKNALVCIDFYKKCGRGKGTYPDAALKRCSNVRDILSIDILGYGAFKGQVVSLVLERPGYGKPLFQNSSEVEEMNLPITVGISCSETDSWDCQPPTWTSEEVVVTLGSGQVVLMLDTPWILSVYNLYKITTRFLSEVYTVPKIVVDGSLDQGNLRKRDETFDFFTATELRRHVRFTAGSGKGLININMSGDGSTVGASTAQVQSTSMSSGLHLIRSMQVKSV